MSGGRRNRILNLNASTPLPLPNHHTLQPSHQQVRPALAHAYQQLPAPVNSSVAAPVPLRPMVIQYAMPHPTPAHPAPPQTRPQPSQIQTPTRALPPPSPTHTRTHTAPNMTAMERLSQCLVAAIKPSLVDHGKSVADKIEKIEGSVEKIERSIEKIERSVVKFAADVKEARNETDKRIFQLTEAMRKSLQIQLTHINATNKRTEKIEALLMANFGHNDEMSLVSRIENIQFTVGELSERVKDPGAQDYCILPEAAQIVNATETQICPTPRQSSEELPLTLVQRIYEDKATFYDIQEPLPELSPSPVGPVYKDAASDAMNLEHESSAMASFIQPEFKHVGNGPRTPSLPPQVQHILGSGLEPSSGSDSDCLRSSTPRKSSETTAGFGRYNDTETLVDLEEFNTSPVSKKQRLDSFSNSVEDDIIMAHSEGDDPIVIDVDTSVDDELPVEFESGLNKLVTDNEAHDDAQMDDERKTEPLVQETIEHPPTFTSLTSDDENIAAPRQTACSSPRELDLFTPSEEQRTLPSPTTTPSAPASPKLSPPNSTIVTTPSLQFTKENTDPDSSSNPEFEPSLLKPDYAELTSIPLQTPPTPESAPLFNVNVTPYSDNGSEIAVSHMVTAQPVDSPDTSVSRLYSPVAPTLEHAEQPQAHTSQSNIPLFLPSKSQSPPPIQVYDASSESYRPFLESPPPSPKANQLSPSKSQPAHQTTPVVVVKPTSSTKAPATIFNTPFKKLKSGNSGRNSLPVIATPQKTQIIKCPVAVRTPRLPVSPQRKTAPLPIVVHSSPIFVPSRSPSPLSVLSSTSEPEFEPDPGLHSVRVIRKKQQQKTESGPDTGTSTRASASVGPSDGTGSGSGSITVPRHIDFSQKVLAKKGESVALTRVKKRKAPMAEQMEPPLKRARQKAVAAEREMCVKDERLSVEFPSVGMGGNVNARGKGKTKERGRREHDEGYRLTNNKTKVPSTKEEKKLRPRALPPGVNWPQKNSSGDNKFDQKFIECEKCYLWYHYGCVGIMDSNDAVAKGDKMFICPPCAGSGANTMLPSDNIVCARPDCEREEKKENEYFMTAILGRHTKVSSGIGRKYMWLVKWDGYSIRECTWEEEEGMSDPQSFIQDFYRKATREGKDPDDDPHSTILLRDAISGGWTDPNA